MRYRQQGTTIVEFALTVAGLLLLLFCLIEIGRVLFVYNALAEGTRRGARLAAVCPVNDPRPKTAVIFTEGGTSLIASGLSIDNVTVEYLNSSGAVVANPTEATNFLTLRYVRVQVVNYNHHLLIPLFPPYTQWTLSAPAFASTVPIESLGYAPSLDSFLPC